MGSVTSSTVLGPVTGLFLSRQEVWMRTATSLDLASRPWPTTCPAATRLVEPSATRPGSVLTVLKTCVATTTSAKDAHPVLQMRVDSWWKQNVPSPLLKSPQQLQFPMSRAAG